MGSALRITVVLMERGKIKGTTVKWSRSPSGRTDTYLSDGISLHISDCIRKPSI